MKFQKHSILFYCLITLAVGQTSDIPDTTYALSGSGIEIPIYIDGLVNFEGTSITITYSSNILSAEDVFINSELLGENYDLVSNVDITETVMLTIYATGDLFSGSGEIASIQFAASGDPGEFSEINFSNLIINGIDQLENSDGGTVFIGLTGCTDEFSCNFNEDAYFDDGSCEYLDCNSDCGGNATLDCANVCDIDPDNNNICGCTDPNAMNFNEDATFDDGSCEFDPPDWFQSNQSQLQAFYIFFEVLDLGNNQIVNVDWVAAFKCLEWSSDSTVCNEFGPCVGSRIWNVDDCNSGVCDVPVMGEDGQSASEGYMLPGDYPAFVIWVSSENSYYSAIPLDGLDQPANEPWSNLYLPLIPKLKAVEFIGLKNEINLPAVVRLSQNYPNPFNPVTTLLYEVIAPVSIELAIFDLQGRKIATLAAGFKFPGEYKVSWDASAFASGIYIANLMTGDQLQRKKMVLLK